MEAPACRSVHLKNVAFVFGNYQLRGNARLPQNLSETVAVLWHSSGAIACNAGVPYGNRFKSQLLRFQFSSLLILLEKHQETVQVFGPLHPCGKNVRSS